MNREQVEKKLIKYQGCRVAYHGTQRGPWIYSTVDKLYERKFNHRDVLPNEVVLDFDEPYYRDNELDVETVTLRLKELKVKYSVWKTGGKGIHIHTFWKGIDKVQDPKLIKDLIADWMLEGTDVQVDRQLMGKHMVRFEYGHHEKALPDHRYKEPMQVHNHFKVNELPNHVYEKYKEEVFEYALKKLRYKHEGIKFKYETPECVKFIGSDEYGQRRDGGKRGIFVLASFYRNLPDEELGPLLSRYNQYNLKEPLLKGTIIQTVNSVREHKGRHVGCRYRHQLLEELGFKDIVEKCEKQREKQLKEATQNNETQPNKKT